jgi:transcriptional regulator with XRE-family HTH domain
MASSVRPTPRPVRRALVDAGDHIATWRKLRGLTQTQVADRAGVSTNTVRRLEGAEGGVSLENTLRVLRALGILESFQRSLDPYESDVGRLRASQRLPQRVRPRPLRRSDG